MVPSARARCLLMMIYYSIMTGGGGQAGVAVFIFHNDPIEATSSTPSGAHENEETSSNAAGVLCGRFPSQFPASGYYILRCTSPTTGRYVKLWQQSAHDLVLCEVQVISRSLCE